MRLLIVFQRRVRLWLAHNAIYLSYYEDHRRNLHNTLCQPYFDEIEKEITSRLKAMEPTLEAAMKAVRELSEAPSSEADLRVKLAEARGELKALEEVENGNGPKRDAGFEARRRSALGAASGQLDGMKDRLEAELRERNALLSQTHRSESAAELCDALRIPHPMLLPWTLGTSAIMRDHARLSKAAILRKDGDIEELVAVAEQASLELHRNTGNGLALTGDEMQRAKRVQALEPKVGQLLREVAAAKEVTKEWAHKSTELGGLRGVEHLLGTLQQLCDWRRWQFARGQRVLALTVLRGTRALAKREKTLALEQAKLRAEDAILAEFGKYASSPACLLSVRPIVKRQLMNCDLKRMTGALTKHLTGDIADSLHVRESRLTLTLTPDPKSEEMGQDMGLTVLTQAGALDFGLSFEHEDGAEEHEMPAELLKKTESAFEKLNYPEPKWKFAAALGSSAAGGTVGPADLEFRIRSKDAPKAERVAVRRKISERLDELRKTRDAAMKELTAAQKAKVDGKPLSSG